MAQEESKRMELDELIKAIDRLNDGLIKSNEIFSKMQSVLEDINRKTENRNFKRSWGPCG